MSLIYQLTHVYRIQRSNLRKGIQRVRRSIAAASLAAYIESTMCTTVHILQIWRKEFKG